MCFVLKQTVLVNLPASDVGKWISRLFIICISNFNFPRTITTFWHRLCLSWPNSRVAYRFLHLFVLVGIIKILPLMYIRSQSTKRHCQSYFFQGASSQRKTEGGPRPNRLWTLSAPKAEKILFRPRMRPAPKQLIIICVNYLLLLSRNNFPLDHTRENKI